MGKVYTEAATFLNPSVPIDIGERFGVSGNGTSSDVAAWQRVAAHSVANPGTAYKAKKGSTFLIDAAPALTFGDRTILDLDGSRFLHQASLVGNAYAFAFGAQCEIDSIEVEFDTGASFQRFVLLGDQSRTGKIVLTSSFEIGTNNDNFDAAVRFTGDDHSLGLLRTKNIRYPLGSRKSDTTLMLGLTIGDVDIDTYCTGLKLYNVAGLRCKGGRLRGRGDQATPDPGFNGILTGGIVDATFSDFIVNDAGEHGIRLGGSLDGFSSRNITLCNMSIARPGQCGFKAWSGWDTPEIKGLTLANVQVFDCSYGNTPGTNEDCCRLEFVTDFSVVGFVGAPQENTNSGYDGIILRSCQNGVVEGAHIVKPVRNALRIERASAQPGTITPRQIENIHASITWEDATEEAVYIDSSTLDTGDPGGYTTLNDVHVKFNGHGCTKGVYARASSLEESCSLRGSVAGNSGDLLDINSLPFDGCVTDGVRTAYVLTANRVVGASSLINTGHIGVDQIHGTAADDSASRSLSRWSNDTNGAWDIISKSRGTTPGSFAAVLNGDFCGARQWQMDVGTGFVTAGHIQVQASGDWGSAGTRSASMLFGLRQSNTFANKMVLTAAGRLGVNELTPDYGLDVNGTIGFTPGSSVTPVDNGDVVFELTSNTTMTVKAKGSDGTVRSGTITLS